MLFLLILPLLFSCPIYSMTDYLGRPSQNNEKVFQECTQSLELYDDFIPGYPAMTCIVEHPHFLELMQRVAAQDALWANRQDRLLNLLLSSIENRGQCFLNTSLGIQVHLVHMFLIAAAQKGHHAFINSQTPNSRRTLLGEAVQSNNLACAQKILEYMPSLETECYCKKTRQRQYLLKAACLDFGPQSEMVQLLRDHGAIIKPEDKHLLYYRLP